MTREEFIEEFSPRKKVETIMLKSLDGIIENIGYECRIGKLTCYLLKEEDRVITKDGFIWDLNIVEHLIELIKNDKYSEYIKRK